MPSATRRARTSGRVPAPPRRGPAGTRRRLAREPPAPPRRTRGGLALPAAWQSMTRAGGIDLPAGVAGMVALNELVVHGWDLARSTGRTFRADEASLRSSEAMLTPDDEGPPASGELFGPPVPVPQGAPLMDRVIALSGRSPDWQPGG
ncbi:TIGR03086 family metal-binding protein [Streptomyces sp. M10(2022)]